LAVYDKLESFRGDAAFGTWLYRIAVNEALQRLRARRSRPDTLEVGLTFDDNGALVGQVRPLTLDAGDPAAREQLRRALEQALGELPEIYRTVFVLRDVEDLSTEEVAEALELTPGAVKTRLHRARLALREKLVDYGSESAERDQEDGSTT
jgi:RNA polymerase sigma-70 factor (ECF subfamily)